MYQQFYGVHFIGVCWSFPHLSGQVQVAMRKICAWGPATIEEMRIGELYYASSHNQIEIARRTTKNWKKWNQTKLIKSHSLS